MGNRAKGTGTVLVIAGAILFCACGSKQSPETEAGYVGAYGQAVQERGKEEEHRDIAAGSGESLDTAVSFGNASAQGDGSQAGSIEDGRQPDSSAGAEGSVQAGSNAGAEGSVQAGSNAGAEGNIQAGSNAGAEGSVQAGSNAGAEGSVQAGSNAGTEGNIQAGSNAGAEGSTQPGSSAQSGGTGTAPTVSGESGKATPEELAQELLDCMNEERAAVGLSALTWNGELADGAAVRSSEAAASFSHVRPDGTNFGAVCSQAMAENLAKSGASTSAEEITDLWMESNSGHRENILDSSLSQAGIAVYESNGKITICALFG